MSERRGETFACGLSRQVAEAEGSLIRVVPERLGSALTKPGRASTARWGGSGERGGKEYARNRRCYVLDFDTGSNLADLGRARRVPSCAIAAGTSGQGDRAGPGGHREGLRRTCGEAAGTQPGSSSAERMTVNTGTAWCRFPAAGSRPGAGIGAPTAERAGRGGAAVVLRAGESPAHGEGRQRLREGKEAAMPQDAPPNGSAQDQGPGP